VNLTSEPQECLPTVSLYSQETQGFLFCVCQEFTKVASEHDRNSQKG